MMYEINVSKDGWHFFATSERSLRNDSELIAVYPIIAEKFPEAEGYHVSVTRHYEYDTDVDINRIMEKAN